MRQALLELAEKVPPVVSMGEVAASGGYFVSCGSDFIMAEETTITGSIGVIAQVCTMEDLADKIGVEKVGALTDRARKAWLRWKEKLSEDDDWLPPAADAGCSATPATSRVEDGPAPPSAKRVT